MAFKRTGNTQTEMTATGVITTAQETGHIKGKKITRWVQIGYASILIGSDGKKYVDGVVGAKLL